MDFFFQRLVRLGKASPNAAYPWLPSCPKLSEELSSRCLEPWSGTRIHCRDNQSCNLRCKVLNPEAIWKPNLRETLLRPKIAKRMATTCTEACLSERFLYMFPVCILATAGTQLPSPRPFRQNSAKHATCFRPPEEILPEWFQAIIIGPVTVGVEYKRIYFVMAEVMLFMVTAPFYGISTPFTNRIRSPVSIGCIPSRIFSGSYPSAKSMVQSHE